MRQSRPLPTLVLLSVALVVLVGRPVQAPAQPSAPDNALLEQANRAFERGLNSKATQEAQGYYHQTIEAYEQLLAAGHQNAKLHYNLGNAYFLQHDLGRAIAHYRLGLRLEGGNERLRANLNYVRSQRRDQIERTPDPQQALLARVFFWINDMSLQAQVTVALGGFLLFWVCASLRLFWQQAAFRWLMAAAACLFLLFATSSVIVHLRHTHQRHGVIVADEAAVRKGNGASYALQFPQPLHSGAEFTVLEERGAWLYIRLPNGADGWIRQSYAMVW